MSDRNWSEIQAKLAAPMAFEILPVEVREWDGKTLACAVGYLQRGDVMNRLDAVLGLDGWQVQYLVVDPDKAQVECRIGVRVESEWHWRSDVGSGDGGDHENGLKAAYSDALKRAATLWGVGRFLYDLGRCWLPCEATQQTREGRPKLRFRKWACNPVEEVLKRARAEKVAWVDDPRALIREGLLPVASKPDPGAAAAVTTAPSPTTPPPAQPGALPALEDVIRQAGVSRKAVASFCQTQFKVDRPTLLNVQQYEELLRAIREGRLAEKAA